VLLTMLEFSRPYPSWLYFLLAVFLIGLLFFSRRLAISQRLRRISLFVPRLAVFALLVMILLNPVKRDEIQLPAEPANVTYLVDCSRSMALDRPIARLDQAKQIIQQTDLQLTANDRPRIHLFRFGEQLASAADISQLTANDDASQLSEALKKLPSRFGTDLPRSIVVFSDGAVGSAFNVEEIAAIYKKLKLPIHVVALGDRHIRGDLAIQELVLPPRAERGTQVPIRAVVRSQGYDGERVLININSPERTDQQPLATLPLTLTGGPQSIELVVEANPDIGQLVLAMPLLPGEAVDSNNQVPFRLNSGGRKIKVLYMEGTAGDEYHWLHEALTEDKDIECLSMYVDYQYVERQRLMRVNDPYKGFPQTREELLQYDCVICSDINRGAFSNEQLDWTVELVAERGGGFAMVGGITSFGAGGWDQTVWDKLIPVDMSGGTIGQGWLYHQFRVQVPPESEKHPIMRIVDDATQNHQVLANMPPFMGTNFIQRLKPAATALAYSAEPIPNVGIMPVMACESYGRGRTFALAPDTTVDWGRYFESQWGEGDNRYFRKFWRNVVRWLTENSIAGNRRLQVETDRVIYRPGQPIQITATAFDESMQATTSYQLTARLFKGNQQTRTAVGPPLMLTPGTSTKEYKGQLPINNLPAAALSTRDMAGLVPCELEIVVTHEGNVVTQSTMKIQLLNDSQELLDPQPAPENLIQLAERTGGKVIQQSSELTKVLSGLPSKKGDKLVSRQPIWDRGIIWFMIIGLLTVEWSLRRWAGFG